jgi:hypothetical protein
MRKTFALVGVLAALCGCNDRSAVGPRATEQAEEQAAARDPSRTYAVGCTADFGDVRQVVGVEVQVAEPQVGALQLGPPTRQVVGEAGRDISPKDFARLEQAIARRIDERSGRQVVERVRIVEVRYEHIGPDPEGRGGPKPGEP